LKLFFTHAEKLVTSSRSEVLTVHHLRESLAQTKMKESFKIGQKADATEAFQYILE
jgi:hypothetical protein